jgi:hypothetical protein
VSTAWLEPSGTLVVSTSTQGPSSPSERLAARSISRSTESA